MNKVITLDESYSTTRRVIKLDPQEIECMVQQFNKPEDKFKTLPFLSEGEGRQGLGGLRTKGYFKFGVDEVAACPETLSNNLKLNIHSSILKQKTLITVITVVYNGEKYIEESILSVVNQTYENVEYIIVDGGSTDSTLDILKRYEDKIDYWVSEKDNGIYEAMNKAISIARGDYFLFLGADDSVYERETIKNIFAGKFLDGDEDLIFGNIIFTTGIEFNSSISAKTLFVNTLHHQSCFYSRKLFSNFRFDASLKICSDYELNLISYLNGYKKVFIPVYVSTVFPEGISRVSDNLIKSLYELHLIRKKHLGAISNIIHFLMKLRLKIKNV